MGTMFEVTNEDIKRLNPVQLTELLLRLLYLEASSSSIPQNSIGGSLNIHLSDGGEDAHVQWKGQPDSTDWFPSVFTLFQSKARNMYESDCKNEILTSSGKLKPRVKDVLDNNGSYILFINQDYTEKLKKPRIQAFRQAIKDVGEPYADTADIRIYDASDISRWVNSFIAAAQSVLEYVGKNMTQGFHTWRQWGGYKDVSDFAFITDPDLELNIQNLRNHFSKPRSVARIVGLSGLGKTRLAYEVFRPSTNSTDSIETTSLSYQVIYCNSTDMTNIPIIFGQMRTNNLSGIIVVDNCDLELHKRLADEVKHVESRLSLLSLDYSLEKDIGADPYIELKPASDRVIEGILRQAYAEIRDSDIKRITEFAQGFPLLAVLLARARLNEEDDIGSLKQDIIAKRLLWGRETEDHDHLEVISACSLFEYIGFEEEAREQRIFVAEKICNEIDSDKFYSIVKIFVKRGIIDIRNRYIRVTPLPLAVRLAADWWSKCSPEKAKRILIEEKMPDRLLEALCGRVRMLHFVPEAQSLTEGFCREEGPFGRAEMLKSSRGSRLFRALVEVNPDATATALDRVFGDWNNDQLREIQSHARRNLVDALEKLCFWEDTFLKGAKIMLAFAAAENETWANNATNQFLQLYHVYLSGTQAAPLLRLQVVDQALSSDDKEKELLAIKALGHALIYSHFTRMGGVENQGSRPTQEDWKPKYYREIIDYWSQCINRLIPIAVLDSDHGHSAREQLANSIRNLIKHGRMDDVEMFVKEIHSKSPYFWAEGLKKIQEAIAYEGATIPKTGLEQLKRWEEMMMPRSLRDRLFLYVSEPAWGQYIQTEEGHHIDIALQKAREIAEECSSEIQKFYDQMEILFEGEQRQGYAFGYRLGELNQDPKSFLIKALHILRKMPTDKINTIVLGGFLAALNQHNADLVQETFDLIIRDEKLCNYSVNIMRLFKPTSQQLQQIITLVQHHKIDTIQLRNLEYGSVLDHLYPEEISNFCDELAKLNSTGLVIALSILYMYCLGDKQRKQKCRNQFRQLVMNDNLLPSMRSSSEKMDFHNYRHILEFLLIEANDNEVALFITNEIIKECSSKDYIYDVDFEHFIPDILKILLSKYFAVSWPMINKSLLSDDEVKKYRLISVLTWHNKINDKNDWPFKDVPDQLIMNWCESNPESAPQVIAEIYPMVTTDENEFKWNSLAEFLLSKFGNDSRMLEIISINLQPRIAWGSSIAYTRNKIKVMEELKNHENPIVRQWASECISYWSKEIEYEEKREQERSIGIF